MAIKFRFADGSYLPDEDSAITLLNHGFLKCSEFDISKYHVMTINNVITDKLITAIYVDTLDTLNSIINAFKDINTRVLLWSAPYSLDYLKPNFEEGD